MRRTVLFLIVALASLGVVIAACNRTPTTPSAIPRSPDPPPNQPSRLELLGPSSIAPGATAQFRAILHRVDGSTQDVTTSATWMSFSPQFVTVQPGGVITGVRLGESIIQAIFSVSATKEVVVVPDGTFRLVGRVGEADSPTTPIPDARVEVAGGAHAGLSAISSFDGRYRLYGVAGPTEIAVTKPGYTTAAQTLDIRDHLTQNFTLAVVEPRPDVSGTYTLRLTIADECRARMPEPLWDRRYTAVLTQAGPVVTAVLSGATFALDRNGKGDTIRGQLRPGRLDFQLQYYDYYYGLYADLVEEIDPTMYLTVSGRASLPTGSAGTLSATLDGAFTMIDKDPRLRPPPPAAVCTSAGHRFVLSR